MTSLTTVEFQKTVLEASKLQDQIMAFQIPLARMENKIKHINTISIASSRDELVNCESFKAQQNYITFALHHHEMSYKFLSLANLLNLHGDLSLNLLNEQITTFQFKERAKICNWVFEDAVCPANYLATYNEKVMELYEKKWAITQADIVDDSDNMKQLYEYIRTVSSLLRKPKPKKTRRGGKKH